MPASWTSRLFRPESWPILVKLSVDLILISIIPLALAVWLTAGQSRRELENAARQNLQVLARATAGRLDQLIDDSKSVARQVALDDSVIAACVIANGNPPGVPVMQPVFNQIHDRLRAVTETNPDHASVFVIGRQGIGLASTNARNVGQNLLFREYCREALAGRNHVSQLLVGKTTREPGVYFASPVLSRTPAAHEPTTHPAVEHATTRAADPADVLGAAVLKLRGEKLWEVTDGVRLGADGFAILVDDAGVVIAHPDRNRLYHSFGPLSAARQAEIDPVLRYSLDTIAALDMPELQSAAADASVSGYVEFTAPPADGETRRSAWVAGYARMKEQPWKVFVVQPARQFEVASQSLWQQQARVGLGVAAVAAGLALWRARSLVRPILAVTGAANQLASGDFEARATKYSDDEVGRLADAFNKMVPQLRNAVELQQSLAIATEVQQALLPDKPPALRRLDVHGHSRYCDSTGGDYYDFADVIDWPDRNALIAVGDVTGHGLGAALVMCTARAALRSAALGNASLGRLLSCVNTILTQDSEHRLYMTMSLMVVDPERGVVRYACAAHDPILAYEPAADTFRELEEGSIPLGAVPGTEYEEYTANGFRPGTVLLLGTDGIWEARNAADEMFGKERLQAAVRGAARNGGTARDVAAAINDTLSAFLAGRPIQDDVTFVVARMTD